jgi:hypothetical protein
MLIWQAAPDFRDAFKYGSVTLVWIDIGVAIVLLATAAALDLALRRAAQSSIVSRVSGRLNRSIAVVVPLIACSAALAIGLQPGLFLYSIAAAAAFCFALAATAAAVVRVVGDRPFATVGFAAVLYCAAAAAAFQIGAAQVAIALLNRT